jgi:hypothetical protein
VLSGALAADDLGDLLGGLGPFLEQRDQQLGEARTSQPGVLHFGVSDELSEAVVQVDRDPEVH